MAKRKHFSEVGAPSRMRPGGYHLMTWDQKQDYSRRLRNTGEPSGVRHGVVRSMMGASPPTFRCTRCNTEVFAQDASGHVTRGCIGGNSR